MKKHSSILYNRTFLMILSLVIAFLTWLFVAQSSKDIKGRTLQNVSVDMQNVDESIGKLGLSTISTEQVKVSVYAEGVIYDIGNLKPEDVVVYPDISKITTAGTYSVELKGDIRDKNKTQNVSVVSVSPATIQIKFDSLETKTIDITTKLSGLSAPENYLIGDQSLNPGSVNLTGPQADISRVVECVAEKKINEELTSTYNETVQLKFLDREGNELKLQYVTPDVTETRVTIPILKKKVVPVSLDYLNVPEGFPANQLKFTISNETIEVAGPEEQVDRYAKISLGYIDIRKLDLNTVRSFEVKLPTGFINTQNIQSVSVKFNSDGMIKKGFNIPKENIKIQNQPLNYVVEATTPEIPNIQIIGPQETVEAMVAGDIVATIDLQESTNIESGQVEVPVKISVPSRGLVWAVGDYKAIISIRDRDSLTEEELAELEEKEKQAEQAEDGEADTEGEPSPDKTETEEDANS